MKQMINVYYSFSNLWAATLSVVLQLESWLHCLPKCLNNVFTVHQQKDFLDSCTKFDTTSPLNMVASTWFYTTTLFPHWREAARSTHLVQHFQKRVAFWQLFYCISTPRQTCFLCRVCNTIYNTLFYFILF